MPVIGAGDRVPGPVRALRVDEDDARAGIFLVGVGPHIEIARRRAGLGAARALEPGMLIRGVVDHQLDEDAEALGMRGMDEAAYIRHRAVIGMNRAVIADVIAVIETR